MKHIVMLPMSKQTIVSSKVYPPATHQSTISHIHNKKLEMYYIPGITCNIRNRPVLAQAFDNEKQKTYWSGFEIAEVVLCS